MNNLGYINGVLSNSNYNNNTLIMMEDHAGPGMINNELASHHDHHHMQSQSNQNHPFEGLESSMGLDLK